jgi:hypothetical protein
VLLVAFVQVATTDPRVADVSAAEATPGLRVVVRVARPCVKQTLLWSTQNAFFFRVYSLG